MKYGNMGIKRSVLIRQNELRGLEWFHRNKILEKFQKTKISTFSLYFGEKSFVKWKSIFANLNVIKSFGSCVFLAIWTYTQRFLSEIEWNERFWHFHLASMSFVYLTFSVFPFAFVYILVLVLVLGQTFRGKKFCLQFLIWKLCVDFIICCQSPTTTTTPTTKQP